MNLETKIQGIPCRVELEYCPACPGTRDTPGEPEGFVIKRVMDTRGKPAAWLERKMTEADKARIVREAFANLRGQREDDAYARGAY